MRRGHWEFCCGGATNLPNDVAAGLDPVVQKGKAGVGDEICETHDCRLYASVCMTAIVEDVVWRSQQVLSGRCVL
jgi:hypothetical protein